MSIWLMKAAQGTGSLFLQSHRPFVGIDEDCIQEDYSRMCPEERTSLFMRLQQAGRQGMQYGLIKRTYDDFCFDMVPGDLIFLGVGEAGQFILIAVVEVLSRALFASEAPRQRRYVCPLWQGEGYPVPQWACSRRLEKLEKCTEAIKAILARPFCRT